MQDQKKRIRQAVAELSAAALLLLALASLSHAALILDAPRPINLAWVDNSNNETGFIIERNLNGGPMTALAVGSIGSNVTQFADGTVTQSTTVDNVYCYQVRAINAAGQSAPSNQDCATIKKFVQPIPAAPSGFVTSAIDGDTLEMNWMRSATGAKSVELERYAAATATVEKNFLLPATAVTYRDNGLPRQTVKCYRGRYVAESAGQWSDLSCGRTR